MRGPSYNFENVVRFVATKAGLNVTTVARVLKASERYMKLAGVIQGAEDADLLRERDAVRYLLPRIQSSLDPKLQMDYLVMATGSDEALIGQILGFEMDYLNSFGPVELEENDDGAPPMEEDHRRHWEIVLRDAQVDLPVHLSDKANDHVIRFCVPSPLPQWKSVRGVASPQGGALETLRIEGETKDGQELIAVFPVARDGAKLPLKFFGVRPWGNKCESLVEALSGCPMDFFNINHLHSWNPLKTGVEFIASVAGFAYSLNPEPGLLVEDEQMVREIRGRRQGIDPAEVKDLSPVMVLPDGVCSFVRALDHERDEFDFFGQIESVDVLGAWDQTIFRLDVTVIRYPGLFALPVYVSQHRLADGYRPKLGDSVSGRLWLQGQVVDLGDRSDRG